MSVRVELTRLCVDRRCPNKLPSVYCFFANTGFQKHRNSDAVVSVDFKESVGHAGPPFLSLN